MKNCLVCVGTSSFDSLISAVDKLELEGVRFFIQRGSSKVVPINYPATDWLDDFEGVYQAFDLMVSHAGAGTVYEALERRFPLVVVPNMERVDMHQLELARYIRKENYAEVVFELGTLESAINAVLHRWADYSKYIKTEFFCVEKIMRHLDG